MNTNPDHVAQNVEFITLMRDTMAQMVPSGTRMLLQRGTEVKITQALGESYTVEVFGNLARIEGADADALGKAPGQFDIDVPDNASAEDKVWAALKTVYDPEIPVNIVELGLIYDCKIQPNPNDADCFDVNINMTLTSPTCAMGPVIIADAEKRIRYFPEITEVAIDLVFEPLWNRDMMSEVAQLELGVF